MEMTNGTARAVMRESTTARTKNRVAGQVGKQLADHFLIYKEGGKINGDSEVVCKGKTRK